MIDIGVAINSKQRDKADSEFSDCAVIGLIELHDPECHYSPELISMIVNNGRRRTIHLHLPHPRNHMNFSEIYDWAVRRQEELLKSGIHPEKYIIHPPSILGPVDYSGLHYNDFINNLADYLGEELCIEYPGSPDKELNDISIYSRRNVTFDIGKTFDLSMSRMVGQRKRRKKKFMLHAHLTKLKDVKARIATLQIAGKSHVLEEGERGWLIYSTISPFADNQIPRHDYETLLGMGAPAVVETNRDISRMIEDARRIRTEFKFSGE